MKILITGSESNLGKYIENYFGQANQIFAFTKQILDISKKDLTYKTITSVNPDIVIHLDSQDNIDGCEIDETSAYTQNTIGTLNVAYPCSILNIPMIYLSTSYVYGNNCRCGNFETDECNPVNIYGETKLAGEKLIRTLCKKYFIIRTGWLFGYDQCFVTKIINSKNFSIFVCSTEVGNPTYSEDLCDAIKEMLHSNLYGIYNCCNPPSMNKSLWIKEIFKLANIEKTILELPENFITNTAKRPQNSSLNISLIKNCFNIDFPSCNVRLLEFMNKSGYIHH
jgi:dTDP-4-dehydrorhamnose reductase